MAPYAGLRNQSGFMAYFSVLLIAALNCVVLFFMSLLAAGDGSAKGIYLVWIVGFSSIALFTLAALVLCAMGKRSTAVGTASLALPAAYIFGLAGALVFPFLGSPKPEIPEFDEACKDTGPLFIAKPALAVESLAYDWEPGTNAPTINYFTLDARGNVQNLQGDLPTFPESIKFTEGRCCQFEGAPSNRIGPFIRRQNSGANFDSFVGARELSADVLVKYKISRIQPKNWKNGLESVDISVTDRRDGRRLATMRYLLDRQAQRGCGATSDGVMDEKMFVLKAIGIN